MSCFETVCSRTAILFVVLTPCLVGAQMPDPSAELVINEFLAVSSTLTDLRPLPKLGLFTQVKGQSEYTDWIELRNRSNRAIVLKDWSLTDDPSVLTKWSFPAGVSIPAGGYLLVFASKKETEKYGYPYRDDFTFLHTNFELSLNGEYLALVRPDGQSIEHEYPEYPPQRGLISYGLDATAGQGVGYLTKPTPWGVNTGLYEGVVEAVEFDNPHGFYDRPFPLTLQCATSGCTIRYTLDNSTPTQTHGLVYKNPLVLTKTSCVRAIAYKANYLPSTGQTQTYVFLDDVPGQATHATGNQQVTPTDYPSSWQGTTGDYQVDPDITDPSGSYGARYAAGFEDDLLSIPSISVVAPIEDLFGPAGIYINQSQDGTERLGSAELLDPDGAETFTVNCGIRMQGGASDVLGGTTLNRWKCKKLSFRLMFRGHYGGRLRHPLFGAMGADTFNTVVLDSRPQNSWVHSNTTQRRQGDYVRDQVSSDLQLALGSYGCHGRPLHLYINGLYWGLYWMHERPDAAFAASYLGGDKEDYDVIKHIYYNAIDGDNSDYLAMFKLSATSPNHVTAFERLQEKLDVPDFIDYMITNYYVGNGDWDHKNWYATHNRFDPNGRWRWHMWDGEHVMEWGNNSFFGRIDTTGHRITSRAPTGLHWDWIRNDEYRMLFADRVQQHFFHDGPLTSDNFLALFNRLTDWIDRAIVGESARWGDYRSYLSPYVTYTRDNNWLAACDQIRRDFIDGRRDRVLLQFTGEVTQYPKNPHWYPRFDAPEFSVDGDAQHGGYAAAQSSLTMRSAGMAIWYSLDGSDPRRPGGAINTPSAVLYKSGIVLDRTVTVKARARNSQGQWSALSQATFATTPVKENLRITELMYHPQQDGAEFIELTNIGSEVIDLTGVRFTRGVSFNFPSLTLEPHDSLLVVEDSAAFAARYPQVRAAIAGQYSGRLSNSGETLALVDALGQVIQQFRYEDDWYPSTDGSDDSLVCVDPAGDPDAWNRKAGWRISAAAGGTPGTN